MKKKLLLLLLLALSIVGLGQIDIVEPMLLPNGVGKISLGLDLYLRYGILDIMEVGLDPLPYIKLGTNIGDIWVSFGYGYFPDLASYGQTSTVFAGLGYYPEEFSVSLSAMYSEREEWEYDYVTPLSTLTIVKEVSVLSKIRVNNLKKNGNITFIAEYNHNMNSLENNYLIALNVGSIFDWNWWIFRELYIYGGIGAELPFEDLGSIGIMAGMESKFQFFK